MHNLTSIRSPSSDRYAKTNARIRTNQHGDSDHQVIYISPLHGAISLSVADPSTANVSLFSHFLWNAGVQLAALIEDGQDWRPLRSSEKGQEAKCHSQGLDGSCGLEPYMEELLRDEEKITKKEDAKVFGKNGMWDVRGMRVLELGAGTGLAGIMAARCGARETVITDYPAPEVVMNIKANIQRNVQEKKYKDEAIVCCAKGHIWGQVGTEMKKEDTNAEDAFTMKEQGAFDRILVADCLWMPWQHRNLMRSIRWFMAPGARAWVVAGFHTGRLKMQGFYDEATLAEEGLEIEMIWERDADDNERSWVRDRGFEDVTARKRWLVIAVLKRRDM